MPKHKNNLRLTGTYPPELEDIALADESNDVAPRTRPVETVAGPARGRRAGAQSQETTCDYASRASG